MVDRATNFLYIETSMTFLYALIPVDLGARITSYDGGIPADLEDLLCNQNHIKVKTNDPPPNILPWANTHTHAQLPPGLSFYFLEISPST